MIRLLLMLSAAVGVVWGASRLEPRAGEWIEAKLVELQESAAAPATIEVEPEAEVAGPVAERIPFPNPDVMAVVPQESTATASEIGRDFETASAVGSSDTGGLSVSELEEIRCRLDRIMLLVAGGPQ